MGSSLYVNRKVMMAQVAMAGFATGMMTSMTILVKLQPSIIAASSRSEGIPSI